MRNSFRTHARHWLHAFAEAGSVPPAHELELLIDPNGALMWTEVRADSSGAAAYGQSPAYDREFGGTNHEPPRGRHPQTEPVGNSLVAPAV